MSATEESGDWIDRMQRLQEEEFRAEMADKDARKAVQAQIDSERLLGQIQGDIEFMSGQISELNQTAQQVQMMLGSRPAEPIAPPAADAMRKALESIKLAVWLLVLIVGYAVWR